MESFRSIAGLILRRVSYGVVESSARHYPDLECACMLRFDFVHGTFSGPSTSSHLDQVHINETASLIFLQGF